MSKIATCAFLAYAEDVELAQFGLSKNSYPFAPVNPICAAGHHVVFGPRDFASNFASNFGPERESAKF